MTNEQITTTLAAIEAALTLDAPKAAYTFTFHTDAGHGWLEVSGPDLAALGFSPADFSRFSYADRRGVVPTYFLEEDCDASKFIARFVEKNGSLPTFKDAYQHNSFVRALPRIV